MRDSPFVTVLLVVAVLAAGAQFGWKSLRTMIRDEVALAVREQDAAREKEPSPKCEQPSCPSCPACPEAPAAPTPVPASCKGMTWRVLEARDGLVHVGSSGDAAHGGTDGYNGDTACSESLPLLCLRKERLPPPSGIAFSYYAGWSGGTARLTTPVPGESLTSRAAADALCERAFGAGFRMGEHHDGGGGWGWWARGALEPGPQKIWATVDDQRSSPWHNGAAR